MVLRPRKSSQVEGHANEIAVIIADKNDDDKKERNIQRSTLSWLLRQDSQQLRFAVLILFMANLYMYNANLSKTAKVGCQEILSSFTSWRRHFAGTASRDDSLLDNLSFHTTRRSDRFPSVSERVQYYMGPKWFHPELQGVPPSSPFGQHWLERYQNSVSKTKYEQPQQYPLILDVRNASQIYDCATDDNEQACQDISFHMESDLPQTSRNVLLNVMDASFLVNEWYSLPLFKYWWNVWWQEGLVGFLYEVYMQCFTQRWRYPSVTPAYLWNLSKNHDHLSLATTLWNSQTPVFGQFRSDSSTIHHSTILWPFIKDRLAEVPKTKNDQHQKTKNSKKIVCWNPEKIIESNLHHDNFISLLDQVIRKANFQSTHVTSDGGEEDLSTCHVFLVLVDDNPDPRLGLKMFHTVLLMPSPTKYQSWILEPFLQPYLHYVPLEEQNEAKDGRDDLLSSVLRQLLWMQANPREYQRIAEHSTLWIYDLFFHPQSFREEERIMRTIIYRYQQFILRAKPISPSVLELLENQQHRLRLLLQECFQWLAQDWLRVAILIVLLLYYPCIHLM